jgi:hypothetical protein
MKWPQDDPLCGPWHSAGGDRLKTHATLAEDQSRKSAGLARCGMPEMWSSDSALAGAPRRLCAYRVSGVRREVCAEAMTIR